LVCLNRHHQNSNLARVCLTTSTPHCQPCSNLGVMAYGAKTCYLSTVGHDAELRVQRWVFDAQRYTCEILMEKWLNWKKFGLLVLILRPAHDCPSPPAMTVRLGAPLAASTLWVFSISRSIDLVFLSHKAISQSRWEFYMSFICI
jgi:hypothetical protein